MTQFKITAKVPTVYQYASLTHFAMSITKHGNGSYSAEQIFDSKDEAIAYLEQRAEKYIETEQELIEAIEEINKYDRLKLDAATAYIEEVEEETED